jgi:hypothetical protein
MRRRVPEQPLRGSDITSVDIQTQDLLLKPLGQIAPVNVCDLFALGEMSDLPSAFLRSLGEFVDRISQEIAEIPDGPSWSSYLDELRSISGERVPRTFRDLVRREGAGEGRSRPGCAELLEAWSRAEALPFELGVSAPKIQKGAAKSTASTSSTPRKRASKAKATAEPVDPARGRLIKQLILERVGLQSESGLKEVVLIAGTRHRAREHYPDLLPQEIISALKDLKETGQLHYSAGRWKRASRW